MSAGRKYRRAIGRHRVLYAVPEIPDDATPQVKNVLAIRNAATQSGTCPACGATVEIVGEPAPGVFESRMEHAGGCPVLSGGTR